MMLRSDIYADISKLYELESRYVYYEGHTDRTKKLMEDIDTLIKSFHEVALNDAQ